MGDNTFPNLEKREEQYQTTETHMMTKELAETTKAFLRDVATGLAWSNPSYQFSLYLVNQDDCEVMEPKNCKSNHCIIFVYILAVKRNEKIVPGKCYTVAFFSAVGEALGAGSYYDVTV